MPTGPGHVVVTSRNHRWESDADTVEVDVFARKESLEFLGRRVPGITENEAHRLATSSVTLPLALEQAGALQVESATSIDEDLRLPGLVSSRILAENPPADYPVGVTAASSLSVGRVNVGEPYAWKLLQRCALFGPEPIQISMLKRGRNVLGEPPADEIDESINFRRAVRELGRYALVRVDNDHKTLQVHRLIQKLLRDDMEPHDAELMQHEVHLMLGACSGSASPPLGSTSSPTPRPADYPPRRASQVGAEALARSLARQPGAGCAIGVALCGNLCPRQLRSAVEHLDNEVECFSQGNGREEHSTRITCRPAACSSARPKCVGWRS